MRQICPWCQTEIVWDEEIGPEETCPNCFNELGDYRSIKLKVEKPERSAIDGDTGLDDDGVADDFDSILDDDDEDLDFDDLDDPDDPEDLLRYEEAVERYLEAQEEKKECPSCGEFMIFAGRQTVTEDRFTPAVHEGVGPSFLTAPFDVNWFVCPSCFHMNYSLSEDDRIRIVASLNKK